MGTSLAILIQLAVAALATSGLIILINNGLMWLRWVGIVYLMYLALSAFKNINHEDSTQLSALG
jgi:threonine/homoserine/homoserine lactone efflux protein